MDERNAWVDRQRREQSGARWLMLLVFLGCAVFYAGAAVAQNGPAIVHTLFGWL